ncbi:MAG TPA: protein-glutamine glutaminase family protein [Candidatus Acidoferrum sp.]
MPSPNAIVAMVIRIDPGVEKLRGAELFRKYPDGFTIVFEGDQTARLYPGNRAADRLEILEELRQMRAPVYVDANPQNRGITQLFIPLVTQVTNISESGAEEMEVELQASHARHLLKRKNPDFGLLLETLRAAQAKKSWLIVTETDEPEIIDARPSPHEPKLPGGTSPEPDKVPRGWFHRWFCRWFCWLFGWCCCVSWERAVDMFNLVSATTCNPLVVPPPCIPFLYPDDGCWARAHEMCRLMIAAGVNPRKVWIDGHLYVHTKNNPACHVGWGWHVAPTICVRYRFCFVQDMVIDPALFTAPVSKSTWKGVQGDPSATLTDTDASVYWRGYIPTDPNYVDTNVRLQYYRLQLKNRSLQPAGPPPYAYCP